MIWVIELSTKNPEGCMITSVEPYYFESEFEALYWLSIQGYVWTGLRINDNAVYEANISETNGTLTSVQKNYAVIRRLEKI